MDKQSGVVAASSGAAKGPVSTRGAHASDHTGPLTRPQRTWAAVLLHWPAAAAHRQTALSRCPVAGSWAVAAH